MPSSCHPILRPERESSSPPPPVIVSRELYHIQVIVKLWLNCCLSPPGTSQYVIGTLLTSTLAVATALHIAYTQRLSRGACQPKRLTSVFHQDCTIYSTNNQKRPVRLLLRSIERSSPHPSRPSRQSQTSSQAVTQSSPTIQPCIVTSGTLLS